MRHGGDFTSFPGRKQTFVDLLDIDPFFVHDIDEMMEDLGYASLGKPLYYHFQRPFGDFDFGLFDLASDEDVLYLGIFVAKHKLIDDLGNDATLTDHIENDLGNDATLTDHMENDLVNDANDIGKFGTHDEALEVINTDFLASNSSSDEGINGQRKKSIRAIQRAHENDEALVSEPFYIFQKFGSTKEFKDKVESSPTIPIRALQEQLQRRFKVDRSRMKTFRAKSEALNLVQGDFVTQYSLLRDYIVELQTRNPDTTVRVDVESEGNSHSETRTFKRIYICLGALKKGFTAGKRDFLGFDGAFMKGPLPGQILSAMVSGPWMDQYAVEVVQQTCSCRKWELNGMPCKHDVAAIWEMRKNSKDVRIPET
ncbi:unnamed protein product [Lactuca saligna]|uniref:SWIM-type domain-containing protein n=1 Tax=Lactuca saligna TaxID=75948 RepID=A0AA36EGI5_LACSI|nr:unnamed protein product [Lactuca saligna]